MKKKCEFCSGSGQVSFFKGVSRFLLSVEECPHCGGTGLQFDEPENRPEETKRKTIKRQDKKKC